MKVVPSTMEEDSYLPAPWRVLTAMLRSPALTQAELRARTRLSHPVIVQQVNLLRERGLLRSGAPLYGRSGRPRIPLSFNWQFRRILAVDVHSAGLTLQPMDLAGAPLGAPGTSSLPGWTPDGLRATLESAISRTLKRAGEPWAGIGIVLPGSVSRDGQALLTCAGMPNCQPDPLATALSERFKLPVVLESEGYAVAHHMLAQHPATPGSLMALSLRHSPRVGMGLLVDGQRIPGNLKDCAGLGQIRTPQNGSPSTSLQALLQAAQTDADARRHAIEALGMVAAHLITALAPEHLAVQGDAVWTDADTAAFQASMQAHASPMVMSALTVDARPGRVEDCLNGMATLLANRLLDFRQGVIASWMA